MEEVHVVEGAEIEPETVAEAEDTQTKADSYHPGSATGSHSGINSDFEDTSAYFDYESLFDDESLYLVEPSEALGSSTELVTPQVQTTAIEPNTQKLPLSSLLPLKCKSTKVNEGEGDSSLKTSHKEVMSDPTALPLTRSQILQPDATVNPSLSSQKDLEQKRDKLFLGSSSQQGDPIEQDLSHRVTTVASPPEIALDTKMTNALGGTHTQEELTEITARSTILRYDVLVVTLPSQEFEGNL